MISSCSSSRARMYMYCHNPKRHCDKMQKQSQRSKGTNNLPALCCFWLTFKNRASQSISIQKRRCCGGTAVANAIATAFASAKARLTILPTAKQAQTGQKRLYITAIKNKQKQPCCYLGDRYDKQKSELRDGWDNRMKLLPLEIYSYGLCLLECWLL